MKTALLFITALVALSECQNDPIVEVELGSFRNTKHGVSGQVFKADDSTIKVKNFNYDGAGKLKKNLINLLICVKYDTTDLAWHDE